MDYKKISEELKNKLQEIESLKDKLNLKDSYKDSDNPPTLKPPKKVTDENISSNLYYKTGEILCERNLKNNKVDGKESWFDKNGSLQCEENYKNGMKHGKSIWYKNNEIYYSGEYVEGFKEGKWILNNDEGGWEQNYKGGLENGIREYSNFSPKYSFMNGHRVYDINDKYNDKIIHDDVKIDYKLQERLDFIYGFDNWIIVDNKTEEQILEFEESGLGHFQNNFEGCDFTIDFQTNDHPLVCHNDFYDFKFNNFYKFEWFLVKNLEICTVEDLDLINSYSFFFNGIEKVNKRLGGRKIMDIVKNYFPDFYNNLSIESILKSPKMEILI